MSIWVDLFAALGVVSVCMGCSNSGCQQQEVGTWVCYERLAVWTHIHIMCSPTSPVKCTNSTNENAHCRQTEG